MSLAGYGANGRRLWRCDTCGLVQPWSDSWSWFGCAMDEDDGLDSVPSYCSAKCRPSDKVAEETRARLRAGFGRKP